MKNIQESDLYRILDDWSFWGDRTLPVSSISRDIILPPQLGNDLALIIQGVRRCGKSTLLSQFPEIYSLDKEQCYYCNFEDPRLINYLNYELLDEIIAIAKKHKPNEKKYFFLDEIQNVEGWEKWLHMQLERPKNYHFVITGSNSFLLSGEFASALTGRHITLELYPFSFNEYRKMFPTNKLSDYLKQGGFPRALRYEDSKKLLQEYFNDIILRDVQKRVKAKNVEIVKQVAKMAIDSYGSELSYRKIAAILEISVETVQAYLEACEQAYLLFSCPYFSYSAKKRVLRNKKFYPIDTGMRRAITLPKGEDLGKNLEQAVFLGLKRIYKKEVFYWHEQGEVDFIVLDNQKIIPYQVTWGNEQERHFVALKEFYKMYPQAEETIFINKDNFDSYF